jgi:hypothetical protein
MTLCVSFRFQGQRVVDGFPFNRRLPIGLGVNAWSGAEFAPEFFDFLQQGLVFFKLPLEESTGQARFGGNAGRGQDVQVAMLGMAGLEITGLDPALVDQRLEAVIGLAEADAEFLRKLALGDLGIVFQSAEEVVAGFQVQIQR